MTTAHRPTWAPAIGGEEQGGMRIFVPSRATSAKNQTAHTKLKFRQVGQNALDELQEKDLRAELLRKEKQHFDKTNPINFDEERKKDLLLLEAAPNASARQLIPKQQDADDEDDDSGSSSSGSGEVSDSDDEEELLKLELERIKRERAEEAAKKARDEAARANKAKESELAGGNPLMHIAGAGDVTFAVKRRWDEDVVFKNQARSEPKAQKRFVNDTIRNDFHKRFLQRYMR